jgi:spore coat protein H
MQDWEKVFDDTEVGRIDITIDPDDLEWIYANVNSDVEFPATMRFQNKWFDETLDSIGFRLRGNTSRQAQKKSFKIAINSFFQGRNFHGLEKLNLNGEHNDPSIVRSKLSFEKFEQIGLKGSRSCHMEVYINRTILWALYKC